MAHACFGDWIDKRNCSACIEESACLVVTRAKSDDSMEIRPSKPKSQTKPKGQGGPKKAAVGDVTSGGKGEE